MKAVILEDETVSQIEKLKDIKWKVTAYIREHTQSKGTKYIKILSACKILFMMYVHFPISE